VAPLACIATILAALFLFCPTARCAADGVTAVSARDFLNSLGTLSAISVRGEKLEKTIECTRYLGVHWLRAGIEGNVPIEQFVALHQQAGLRFSWGLGSGGSDIGKLIETGRQIEATGALLAFEDNLTAILADNGSAKTAKKLDYSIPKEPETVHDLLLQKSNGIFELVLWSELLKGTNDVKVIFSSTHAWAKLYDPTDGTMVTQNLTNVGLLSLTLSDHPLVVELAK
jgi:hypothetical protein